MTQNRFLYETVTEQLLGQIRRGSFEVGERLPSVRRMSDLFGVSVNTIRQSYRQLEAEGSLESRPKSGVFIRSCGPGASAPAERERFPLLPVDVSLSEDVLRYMEFHAHQDLVRFGIALPGREIQPVSRVLQMLRDVARHQPMDCWDYIHPDGSETLTQQLARRSLAYDVPFAADDIIVSGGCMEALALALRTVTRPGDVVAVEAPTYYGALLLLEELERRVVEIPANARDGISLTELERVYQEGEVAACLVSTNAQNPLGFTMSTEGKKALVELSVRHGVPLIENDIWGDTVFDPHQSRPAKAFDRHGMVIYCNSFSKSLIPGFRLGWTVPGRFHRRVRELKQISTITTASATQLTMGRLLETGFYAQHVVELRERLQGQVREMVALVKASFPDGTLVTEPSGGCVLWIRLPPGVQATRVFDRAIKAGIHVFPGNVFSLDDKHSDHLRINAGNPVTPRIASAVRHLGALARP